MIYDGFKKERNGIGIHYINNRKLKRGYFTCLFENRGIIGL